MSHTIWALVAALLFAVGAALGMRRRRPACAPASAAPPKQAPAPSPAPAATSGTVAGAAGKGPAAGRNATPAARAAAKPAPAVAVAAEPAAAPAPAADETPTTVTECVLSMSISCEEYILQNLSQMAGAALPTDQRETLRRLVEETDDKLARLRAARRRHRGEELVRLSWGQLPEVDLPVVQANASVEQVRSHAIRQTEVMIDFYRKVAATVQRPSLKSLLVNLALDGQRHLAVIGQTAA